MSLAICLDLDLKRYVRKTAFELLKFSFFQIFQKIRFIKMTANINRQLRVILQLTHEYIEICASIEKYNEFWKYIVGVNYFAYITNFVILMFNIFVAPIPDLSKKLWAGLWVMQGLSLVFIAYSGDIVSRKAYKPYQSFQTLVRMTTDLRVKRKVCIKNLYW